LSYVLATILPLRVLETVQEFNLGGFRNSLTIHCQQEKKKKSDSGIRNESPTLLMHAPSLHEKMEMNKDPGNASTLLRAASPSPDQMKIVCRRVKCCWDDEATRCGVSFVCDAVVKMSVGVNTSRRGVSPSIKEKKRKN
jgi:hypothetical protein